MVKRGEGCTRKVWKRWISCKRTAPPWWKEPYCAPKCWSFQQARACDARHLTRVQREILSAFVDTVRLVRSGDNCQETGSHSAVDGTLDAEIWKAQSKTSRATTAQLTEERAENVNALNEYKLSIKNLKEM